MKLVHREEPVLLIRDLMSLLKFVVVLGRVGLPCTWEVAVGISLSDSISWQNNSYNLKALNE